MPTIIGTTFVFCRFYTRAIISRAWGADDTIIVIAWVSRPPSIDILKSLTDCYTQVLSIVLAALNLVSVKYGAGRHQEWASLSQALSASKFGIVSILVYQVVGSVTKVGISAFYLRVFQDRTSKILCYGMIGVVFLYTIPLELVVVLSCKPVEALWNFLITNAKCLDRHPGIYSYAILNILVDVLLMVFIVVKLGAFRRIIYNSLQVIDRVSVPLQMPRRQKISLLAIVSLGVLVIVASIIRLTRVLDVFDGNDYPCKTHPHPIPLPPL